MEKKYLGQVVKDCDELNLQVRETLLGEKSAGQLGLFAKTLFLPKQIICQARGPLLKRQHLHKLLLNQSDILIGTADGYLIHCNSICKHVNDIIFKPKTQQQFLSLNHKSLRPFKWQPTFKYNARFATKNSTQTKVFLQATAPIHSGQEIYVRHDADVWLQKMRCGFEMEEIEEGVRNM